jgi:hypothetical protein
MHNAVLRIMRSSNGEIIGERTCDKMSAARRKGKWVGGGVVSGAVNCTSNTGWGARHSGTNYLYPLFNGK